MALEVDGEIAQSHRTAQRARSIQGQREQPGQHMDKAPIGLREQSTGPSPEDDPAKLARSHRDRLRDDLVTGDGAHEHLIHGSGRDAGRMHGAGRGHGRR